MFDLDIKESFSADNFNNIEKMFNEISRNLDNIINQNERLAELVAGLAIEPGGARASGTKRVPVSEEVRLLLALAGDDGMTSGEVLRELQRRRSVTWAAVRQALHRLRVSGNARRTNRAWCLVS